MKNLNVFFFDGGKIEWKSGGESRWNNKKNV